MKSKIQNQKFTDRRVINIHEEKEVIYWSKLLGCSPEELKKAVKKAGTSPIKVIRELEK